VLGVIALSGRAEGLTEAAAAAAGIAVSRAIVIACAAADGATLGRSSFAGVSVADAAVRGGVGGLARSAAFVHGSADAFGAMLGAGLSAGRADGVAAATAATAGLAVIQAPGTGRTVGVSEAWGVLRGRAAAAAVAEAACVAVAAICTSTAGAGFWQAVAERLRCRFELIAGPAAGLRGAHDNQVFTSPDERAWARVTFLADEILPVAIGGGAGHYRARGSLDVSIFLPLRSGEAAAHAAADTLASAFDGPAGGVRFANLRIGSTGVVGQRWRVDVSVDWFSPDVTGLHA
jgi:hypothetical protein